MEHYFELCSSCHVCYRHIRGCGHKEGVWRHGCAQASRRGLGGGGGVVFRDRGTSALRLGFQRVRVEQAARVGLREPTQEDGQEARKAGLGGGSSYEISVPMRKTRSLVYGGDHGRSSFFLSREVPTPFTSLLHNDGSGLFADNRGEPAAVGQGKFYRNTRAFCQRAPSPFTTAVHRPSHTTSRSGPSAEGGAFGAQPPNWTYGVRTGTTYPRVVMFLL